MTDARIAAENRFDGPMPPEVIDRLRHGSVTAAEIVRCEASMLFFRTQHGRTIRSAVKWLMRGNVEMHDCNRLDARLYFREWRALRRRLADLRATDAAVKGAKRVLDIIAPREPGDGC